MDREGACLTWPSGVGGGGVGRRTGAGRYVPCPSPRLLGGAESHTSLPVSLPTPTPSSQILGKSKELVPGLKQERFGFTHTCSAGLYSSQPATSFLPERVSALGLSSFHREVTFAAVLCLRS